METQYPFPKVGTASIRTLETVYTLNNALAIFTAGRIQRCKIEESVLMSCG